MKKCGDRLGIRHDCLDRLLSMSEVHANSIVFGEVFISRANLAVVFEIATIDRSIIAHTSNLNPQQEVHAISQPPPSQATTFATDLSRHLSSQHGMVSAAAWGAPVLVFIIVVTACICTYLYRRDPRPFHNNINRFILRRKAREPAHRAEDSGSANDDYSPPQGDNRVYR